MFALEDVTTHIDWVSADDSTEDLTVLLANL